MQTNTTAFKFNGPVDLPITRESVKAQDLSYLDGRLIGKSQTASLGGYGDVDFVGK